MTHAPVTRRIVGSWEILDVIGSGSFAIVWKARHVSTGGLSAVKEILADRLNKKLQESLESEIAVLHRLKHLNIVGLLDLYKEPGKIFLVLEYCGGGDLAHHLRQRGPLSEASCRYLLRQLAEGLKVLRQNNVIHRDLKPQNLLLSDNGPSPTLKIADFGFARSLQPAGLAETLCGSPLYMAPEVLQLHRYDAKADLWSVGTILFELLTGKPPFSGANHYQLVQNIERGEAVLPEHIARMLSAGCRQLLHQLLRRNPVERISFDEFFAHPFLIGEAASAAVTPLPGSAAAAAAGEGAHLPSASAAAVAWAPQQQQQQQPGCSGAVPVPRRYTPTSQGAVRFVQPVRCGSPVHPAFQVPSPQPSSAPSASSLQAPQQQHPHRQQHQQHQQQQVRQEQEQAAMRQPGGNGTNTASAAAGAGVTGAQGGTDIGGVPGAARGLPAEVSPSGPGPGPAGAAISVRELNRSPSPRIIAAAALMASSLADDLQAAAGPRGAAGGPQPGPPGTAFGGGRLATGPGPNDPIAAAAAAGAVSGGGLLADAGGGLAGALSSCSSRPLVDSLDSDYVVVSSPSAVMAAGGNGVGGISRQPSAPLSMSPRTPHPAMLAAGAAGARAAGSRGGSQGGGAPPQPPSPPQHPTGAQQPDVRPQGGDAHPPQPQPPSWQQQLLSPIAAASLPPLSQGLPYTLTAAAAAAGRGVMGPQPPSLANPTAAGYPSSIVTDAPAAAAGAVADSAAPPNSAMVTIRAPQSGGSDPEGPGGSLLLPRVVGVLLDHARSRCSALLDADAEARQLGDTQAALGAGGQQQQGFGQQHGLGGVGAGLGPELADEAAAAVGTLLVACRLLVSALCNTAGGAAGSKEASAAESLAARSDEVSEGGRSDAYAGAASSGDGEACRVSDCRPVTGRDVEAGVQATAAAAAASVAEGAGKAALERSSSTSTSVTSPRSPSPQTRGAALHSADASPPSPPSPSPAALAALAAHARCMLAALDEHLHGTVARLLLEGASAASGPPSASSTRSTSAAAAPPPPLSPPQCTTVVPCGLDALLAAAVHHSRAAAGEELLGNAAGAAEHYGRAADVLLFLLEAPQPQQQSQQLRAGSQLGGSSTERLLDGVRPPLCPHDRQRLTKYYAAVRLRQSAALAAAGPAPAAAGAAPSLSYGYPNQPHTGHDHHRHAYQHQHHILGAGAYPHHNARGGQGAAPHHLDHLAARHGTEAAGQHAGTLDGRQLVMAAVSSPHHHQHHHQVAGGPVSLAAGPNKAMQVAGGLPYGYEQPKDFGAVVF